SQLPTLPPLPNEAAVRANRSNRALTRGWAARRPCSPRRPPPRTSRPGRPALPAPAAPGGVPTLRGRNSRPAHGLPARRGARGRVRWAVDLTAERGGGLLRWCGRSSCCGLTRGLAAAPLELVLCYDGTLPAPAEYAGPPRGCLPRALAPTSRWAVLPPCLLVG